MSKDKVKWVVCGRAIGFATGWDQSETFALMLYDFEPGYNCKLPKGDALFRFETGLIEIFDEKGDVAFSGDLIEAIKDAPIERTD